jgi:hypothetical protein
MHTKVTRAEGAAYRFAGYLSGLTPLARRMSFFSVCGFGGTGPNRVISYRAMLKRVRSRKRFGLSSIWGETVMAAAKPSCSQNR